MGHLELLANSPDSANSSDSKLVGRSPWTARDALVPRTVAEAGPVGCTKLSQGDTHLELYLACYQRTCATCTQSPFILKSAGAWCAQTTVRRKLAHLEHS